MDPNAIAMGEPLLQKAAMLANAEIVKLIIDRGGDIHYKDGRGSDALIKAQNNFKNSLEVITDLIEAGIDGKPDTSIAIIAGKIQGGKFKSGKDQAPP
jgi:hypothetical protein